MSCHISSPRLGFCVSPRLLKQLSLCRKEAQSLRQSMFQRSSQTLIAVCLNKNIQISPQSPPFPISPFSSIPSKLTIFEKCDLSVVSYQCLLFTPNLNLHTLFLQISWFIGWLGHLKFMFPGFLLLLLFRFQSHNSKLREYREKSQAKPKNWGGAFLNIILNTSARHRRIVSYKMLSP